MSRRVHPIATLVLCLLVPSMVSPLSAQERPRVLVLGTYHMANHNLDAVNPQADDVRAPQRQAELEELVRRLRRFEPTHIAVERAPEQGNALQARYKAYLAGSLEPARDEIYQVAFRLAEAEGHERLYPVDYKRDLAMGEVMSFAAKHQPGIAETLKGWQQELQRTFDEVMTWPIPQIFLRMNDAEMDAVHSLYLLQAQVGAEENYPGADMVGDWYVRNLRIYANIARLATDPGDRILVLIGAGHGALLREYLRHAPNLDLVDQQTYLEPVASP